MAVSHCSPHAGNNRTRSDLNTLDTPSDRLGSFLYFATQA
jgi:hypothetical protein